MLLLLIALIPHIGVAVAALSAGMMFEHWFDPGKTQPFRASDVGYAVVNVGLVAPVAIALLSAVEPFVQVAQPIAISHEGNQPMVHPLLGLVLGFFIFEFLTYGLHRLWHASPTFMRFHRVHHGPHISILVAFRMHPLETLAYMLIGNLPLVILGMPAWGGIYVLLAERTYNVLLHARVPFRLGLLGSVFASGEFHHRHHASGKAANFGGVVSIFDHLFGTAAPSVEPKPAQGAVDLPVASEPPVVSAIGLRRGR